jgi:hypothetical protein
VIEMLDSQGGGNSLTITSSTNTFKNCWHAYRGAAFYTYSTSGDTYFTDTDSNYLNLAAGNHGGALFLYYGHYYPTNLDF